MAETFGQRIRSGWNAFRKRDEEDPWAIDPAPFGIGIQSSQRSDRPFLSFANSKTDLNSIYTQLSIDIAAIDIRHARVNKEGRYLEEIFSPLNECLSVEANIDQAASQFRQDIVLSLFDTGVTAIVPVDTSRNPNEYGNFDIYTLRVGKIVGWYPEHVRVSVWNVDKQIREEVVLRKKSVAIVENPLYAVMNAPNSTLQRLNNKLRLLDYVDEQVGSGKLDLILQFPYTIKSDSRQAQAEKRRKMIEDQLNGSKYGIAYTDGTERITQLNRPVENNLLKQVEDLTAKLYKQLGLTPSVFDGTADEATMVNYYNRTIEPVVRAITEAMTRTFLTKTARTQGQKIVSFRDPFKLVPVKEIAEIADKFTRNEIATSNEIRGIMGWAPSDDPKADKLMNPNMPQPDAPSGSDSKTPSSEQKDISEDNSTDESSEVSTDVDFPKNREESEERSLTQERK